MKTLRLFISSPGDVFEERAIANRVIERLQSEYIGKVVLEPVLWEHEPLVATSTFQHQIVKPSDTDVVIAILWSRLGTRLPKEFARPDGTRYESGTEYEFEEAIEGFRKNGKPDLLVYRKTAPPSVRLDDEKELLDRLSQKKKLDEFIGKWFHDQAEGTIVAAFHLFEAPSDFENSLENHLHRLIDRQIPGSVSSTSEARAVWKKGSPFRGLAAFEFEHAPVFFGRTRAVSDILQALRDQAADGRSFVLVLGMSGGGKSSVVRAGVLPMLTRPGVIEGVDIWRRAVYRPTDVRGDLFSGLAKALLREHALPSLDSDGTGPEELAQILQESPQAATSLIKNALSREQNASGGKANARLALVIDQMEEMYTQEEILPKHRRAFGDVLDALARCGRVWVIGTLRSDFYPRLADLPKLVALKEGDGQYDLMPPTASEIGQMIRLPTRAAGLRFEEDAKSSERLDDMLRDAAAEHPEVLPLLQFTLEELYQRRTEDGMLTLQAYRDLGGVEGSLAQRAEKVFKDLPDDVEAELPKVLNALVSIEHDGHETIGRKRAPWTDASTGKSRELIETFVKNRLFVTELADDGSAVVTVAHEALLWHWPRVKDWVAQNRENLRMRGRIAAAAERWKADNRPIDLLLPSGKPLVEAESLLEQDIELSEDEASYINASIAKAKRLQRLKAGVVAALAVLGIVAAWSAWLATEQRDLANQARARAEVEAETAKQTTDFMVGLFEVSDPSEALGNTITAREIMDKGADRIETELTAQPAIQATLMETMGSVYTSLGLYDQAVPLLQGALDKRAALYGTEHLEVARSVDRLAEVLTLKAEYEPALKMYEDALAVRRKLLGNEHKDTAHTIYELADLLGRMGSFAEAEPLYREALELQRKLIGEQSLEVAKSLEGLGLNRFDQGSYDDAVQLLRDAVAIQRKLHSGPHPDLAEAINNLGFVTNDNSEAEQLFRESLAMKRILYPGEAHPEIAMGLNNVAFVLQSEGKYDEAGQMYQAALEMQQKLLGDNHPDIAMALNNLAFVAYEKGDLDKAISLSKESLDMYRRTVGNEHPSAARGMNNLAMWQMEEDNYVAAEPLLREALDLRKKLLGPEHTDVAGSLTLLADLLIETNRFDEALLLARDAKTIYLKTFSADHWRTASAASAEGAALAGLKQYEEAEPLLVESFNVLRAETSALPYFVAGARRWLVNLYDKTGRPDQAAKARAIRTDK
ncbi:MAG: tetratricopeptide repeat protein [Gammaproteobacteria bacterium]|nr:tetratricopeptide repeat protein [Gammaproteobacteria bacterium]MDH4315500.1 tetratricopeptide repeat protein [Gammaproteobacteria bacterium]MDH5214636.1 tetratricopeptide repeat protein [Gammaproteobacteria bacterium]MDH5499630.1 tetratricopeptide repeat protein [Gammaproteobacteria bacterium]